MKLQEEINHQGLEILSKYVEEYKILTEDIKGYLINILLWYAYILCMSYQDTSK